MISSQHSINYQSPLKNNQSDQSGLSTHSASPTNPFQHSLNSFLNYQHTRLHLFQPPSNILQFQTKCTKKAVSWIMTICWSKNFNSECLWTTLILFYAYKSKNNIEKSKLQAIILVCLQLSSKFNQGCPLKTSQLLQYSSHPISSHDLISIEYQLLKMVDFNLIFQNSLSSLIRSDYFQEQRMQMVCYLCELYLLRSHHILFDEEKLQKIVRIIEGSYDYQECELEFIQIKEMMGDRQSKILNNKFDSKFDVEAFQSMFA